MIHREGGIKTSSKHHILQTNSMKLTNVFTIVPVSSPTGRIHFSGNAKPYYNCFLQTAISFSSIVNVLTRTNIRTVPVSRKCAAYAKTNPASPYIQSRMLPGALYSVSHRRPLCRGRIWSAPILHKNEHW